MAGNTSGGKKAAITNKIKYGADFYAIMGRKGGKASSTGGFKQPVTCMSPTCEYGYLGMGHLIRQCAGARGGTVSRRKTIKNAPHN